LTRKLYAGSCASQRGEQLLINAEHLAECLSEVSGLGTFARVTAQREVTALRYLYFCWVLYGIEILFTFHGLGPFSSNPVADGLKVWSLDDRAVSGCLMILSHLWLAGLLNENSKSVMTLPLQKQVTTPTIPNEVITPRASPLLGHRAWAMFLYVSK
jgi:hypothetical protein